MPLQCFAPAHFFAPVKMLCIFPYRAQKNVASHPFSLASTQNAMNEQNRDLKRNDITNRLGHIPHPTFSFSVNWITEQGDTPLLDIII